MNSHLFRSIFNYVEYHGTHNTVIFFSSKNKLVFNVIVVTMCILSLVE